MAESSEALTPIAASKIIVIKLPFDLQERLLAFPFFHLLHEYYPQAELHLITTKKDIEVLNLMPFKAYYHEFEEEDIKTVFDVHRYVVNAKIYKVDLFISLSNSFLDACLGMALRAKERLGFSDGWKTLLLNQKTTRPMGHHLSEDFFSLLKVHRGGEIDTKIKVMSRELPAVISDWDSLPYIAVNLSPIRSAIIEEEWLHLISQFSNQRFVFFASDEQDKVQLLIDAFIAKLPKQNVYLTFLLKDWIEIAKMTAFARGIITYNGPGASVAAYTGSKTIILYDSEDPQRYAPLYFLGDIVILKPEEQGPTGIMRPRKTFDMGVVADRAHDFFRL